MKVIEHLSNAKEPLISFEIIPPLRGGNIENTLNTIGEISKYNPPFIDITSHPANIELIEVDGGVQKIIRRKRPGTLGICALIQHKFGIDAVPHILCNGFNRQETEDFLIELSYLGIDNVVTIRGDDTAKSSDINKLSNKYAIDLVKQVQSLNMGIYENTDSIGKQTDFCIGVAGYPECHIESPNSERDIYWTQQKIKVGAHYIITQMFLNNKHFWNFKDKIKLDIPIIPGIKIITSKKHITSLPKTFQCEIPEELVVEVERARPEQVPDIGVEWAHKQITELFEGGIQSVHLYIMQSSNAVHKLMKRLGK
jgi:methylenetetrahydrofolate reductase (NADPH)